VRRLDAALPLGRSPRRGLPAAFTFAAFNGRGLSDDVMDVILTLATNRALGDRVAPDKRLMRAEFPYFGEPHATAASSAKQ